MPGQPGKTGGEAQAGQNEPMPYLAVVEPRKVVYKGQFSIVVGEVAPALAATRKLADQLGGYMQSLTSSSIVFRVPADKFDQAVTALEKIGAVTDKSISAQDVTEQYTDLQIRLTNAKALLEKLRALLDKSQDVKTALEVEKELARVRTEIEQMEGQLNRLQSQIALATITVNFSAMKNAPSELKVNLPFWWLKDLGLDRLLNFKGAGSY